ncbi:MAG TPA: hypothetical protein VEL51_10270 [Vicinamibacterales bacterium]|nr:hypothetical protein [Vicinamibacterales bacterium]
MIIQPTTLLLHLRIVGLVMALLVAINVFVPGRFNWREELGRVSLLNRQIFQAHSICIVLMLALFAALFFTCTEALLEPTRLSRAVLIGLTIFWGLRMLMQWFFYSPAIWRGDRFNTIAHGVFSVTWIYVTAVCAIALWANINSVS